MKFFGKRWDRHALGSLVDVMMKESSMHTEAD
jgi:hypothetical protein